MSRVGMFEPRSSRDARTAARQTSRYGFRPSLTKRLELLRENTVRAGLQHESEWFRVRAYHLQAKTSTKRPNGTSELIASVQSTPECPRVWSSRSSNMSEKEKAAKTRAQFLRDAFEGMNGHQPKSDNELNQWLATDEGKAATLFDDTTLSPWGERGRS
jgi:hypothetical protein